MGSRTMTTWTCSLGLSLMLVLSLHGAIQAADQEVQDFEFADNEIKLVKRAATVESDDEDFLADEPGSGIEEYEGSGDATNPPVVGYPKYYRVQIKVSIEFYPELDNRNSEQFRLVAEQLQKELENLYRSIPGQQLVTIIEFSSSDRGEVLATFDLGSSGFTDDEVLKNTLETSLRGGYMGAYRVAPDEFSFRVLDAEIQCPSYVGRRPEDLARGGNNWANLMVNNAFPCAGRLVGWEYYRSTRQGDAFAGIWRQRSNAQFTLVKKSLLPSAEVGAQQVAVYPPIDVQRGDFIGIFYPYDTRQNVIAQATLEDDVVTANELYQTFNAQVYEESLSEGQVLDLNRISYTTRNATFAIRALMDYTGGDGGTVIFSCNAGEFSCGDGYCIPAEQQCDGEVDCEFTRLDEKECQPCSAEEFTCPENGECVPKLSLCDGIMDCPRGSDEENCPSVQPPLCDDNQFRCSDGACIDISQRCDGTSDCPRGEDEYRCEVVVPATCSEGQFTCIDGQCIPLYQTCDSYPDCNDLSDEDPDLCLATIPTVPPSCPDGHFRCDKGICLPGSRECDGVPDCTDGTDEQNCEGRLCDENQFRCRDGTCISARRQCDNILDCPDQSDEENCVRTCGPNEFTCSNGRCIDLARRCDDIVDCTAIDDTREDRSDEDGCPCKPNEFECSDGSCIPMQLTCDNRYDCTDGGDERNCPCRENQFRCGDGLCIPDSRVCDKRPDCDDGSDERDCGRCRRNQFECGSGQCVDRRSRCDRVVECTDGSDEANCSCASREFKCANGQCVTDAGRCDRIRDCFDGSDEAECVTARTCRPDQFTCEDGTCIDSTRKCDGRPDCPRGLDESDCPRRRRCPEGVFECDSGHCLPMERRCNGRPDCPNGSDEVDCPTCSPQEFTCELGGCIPLSSRCDERPDCRDRSDERNCPCGEGEFTCVTDGRCLPPGYRCNGNPDCRDGSDEQGCTEECDEQREFRCSNGDCISRNDRCDGKYDCRDGSDERGCPSPVTINISPQQLRVRVGVSATFICQVTGNPTPRVRWSRRTGGAMPVQAVDANNRLTITNVQPQDSGDYLCTATNTGGSYEAVARLQVDYIGPPTEAPEPDGPCGRDEATCTDGQCIPRDYRCDGEDDCSDGSDERSCNAPLPCEPNEFRCNNGRCALKIWRCDGDDDCFDRSDETNCPSRKPGDPCNSHEFMCASGDQCVPLSYQCDEEIDCIDRSDEIACSAPTIIRPPPREITVDINGTFTIICEAMGVPDPLITWRLNWGNIPSGDRVTVISNNGRGTLTVRFAGPEDSGAYTCEAINNRGSIFAVPDALIIVRQTASVCPPPLFNSDATRKSECVRCFCFGQSQTCYSSDLQLSQITLGNRVTLVKRNTLEPTEEGFVQHIRSSGEFEVRDFNNVLPSGSYYWSLPYQYLSSRLNSYGGELSYQVYYEVDRFDVSSSDPDVIITGNGITLYHRSGNEFRPRSPTTVRVPLVESAWERQEDFASRDSSISTYASREDLMMVLDNVTNILIRATYDNRQSLIRLGNVLLSTAVTQETGLGRALFVEQCTCPVGYGGYSCQECAPGFYKVERGRYGRECIACNCNGHSNECDRENGICRNCRDNTAGPYCNECAPGFVGDARTGRCNPCPCPLTIPSNQFSPTCVLDFDGEVTCNACPRGYIGRQCERCAEGYVGNPTVPGDRCRVKEEVDEICDRRGSYSNYPDRFTSKCDCKRYVQGRLCDECKPSSFFLSEDFPHGCVSCFCMSVTQTCQSTSWNRAQVGVTFINSPSGVFITDMVQKQKVEDGLRVISGASRELTYRGFSRLEQATYYWSLPERFLGDKVTAYGGDLRFTLRHRAGRDNTPTSLNTPLVEIGGNDITLVYRANSQIQNNDPQSFQVRFIETEWSRIDGKDATREHLMMALADLDFIIIRATFTEDTDEAAISGISLDVAEDRVTGQGRAEPVEQCACPRGYKGLSCEDCDRGYKRTGGGLYLGLCEPCDCNGHSSECDPESGVCRNCRHNTLGDKCERCDRGFYGDATRGTVNDCQKCPCPLTESPNQFSPDCMLDTDGRVSCLSCPTGHVGRQCERCADGYEGNPMRQGDYCKLINVTCDCDRRGTVPNTLCDPDTQQCQCKNFALGRRCSSCQEGFFNLAESNEQGCLKCYCMATTNECSASSYYRDEITPMLNSDGSHNFALTNRRLSRRITDGFTVDAQLNEVTFNSFEGIQRDIETLYFLLPPKFRGNKVTSYGGFLKFGISYTASLDMGNYINDIDLEIISNQDKRLYQLFRPAPQSGKSYEYSILLTEDSFRNPMDSAPPSREFFLTALANIKGIIIRAAYWSIMESVTLSDLRMENAVPRPSVPGQRAAPEVEACVCPEGYTGLSCEECAQGFVRARGSGSALGVCIRCNCNGHATSCDTDTGECMDCTHNTEGERCERCIRGYYGDPTDGNPDACRECPCPLTISSNQFSPSCYLDEDNQPTCDRCAPGYVGRNCGQCAPGYAGNPSQPGGRCQPEGGDLPEIIINPRSVVEPVSSTATFTCAPRGRGPFNVVWSRVDRRPLPRRARQGPGPDYRLTISQLEYGDAGRYVCTVTNIYGSSREAVDITIESGTPIRVRIEEPTMIDGRIGATARFICVAYQYSIPASIVLSWTKDGGNMPFKAQDQNGVLTIPNLQESDAGTYTCTGSDPNSVDTARAVIRFGIVERPPQVRIEPRYLQVSEGAQVEFRCFGEGSPTPTVRWTKGADGPLPSYVITDESGLFRIESVSRADQSEYYCTATNSEGSTSVRTIVYVQRTTPTGRVVIREANITAVVGTSERLYCTVEGGNGDIDLSWNREGGLPVGTTQENGVLYLTNIQPSFRGTYICVGTGITGIVGRATAVVTVIGERYEAPQVTAMVERVNISTGATETLRCVATGSPRPTITWSRAGRELSSNHRVNGDTLRILQASMEDRGIYVCMAENRAGRAQAVIYVEVERRDPPMVKLYPETQQVVRAGGNAIFYCMVSGIPTPTVEWTRANGRELTDRTTVEQRTPEDLALRFIDISTAEQGEYLCSATNAVGTVTATASIRVEGPPVIEITPGTRITSVVGERVNVECVGIGSPTPNVFWRSGQRRRSDVLPEAFETGPGSASLRFEDIGKSDAGRYICVATGEGGRAEESVDITVLDRGDGSDQGVIIEGPQEQTHLEGQSVELTCTAVGVPNPRITWRRAGGLPLPPGHSVTNGVLFIPRINSEYQGEYICTVSSRLLERDFTTSIIIIVRVTPQVDISPSRGQFRAGQRMILRCSPTGRGPYNIEWTKVDGVLSPQARESNGVLEIAQVTRADAGRYRCVVRGVDGTVSEGIALVEVSSPPEIVGITRLPEILQVGNTYMLECTVVGQGPIEVRWEKENGPLPVQHSIRNGILTLYNVRPEDSGRYICTASNVMGSVRDYTFITVRDFATGQTDGVRIVYVGNKLELECLPQSRDNGSLAGISVSWSKQGQELPDHSRLAGDRGGVLLIDPVRMGDAGVYICTITNNVGSTTRTVKIIVEEGATISGPETSFTTAALGTPVDLRCDASGSPPPRVEWVKTEGDLPPEHQTLPDGTLRIPRVAEEDAGEYECRTKNGRGTGGMVVYPVMLLIGALVPYFEQNPVSYMQFAPLNDMYIDLDLLLSFRPEASDGLIFYNGQYDSGSGDFVCFGLNQAIPVFRFDVGAGPAIINGTQPLEMDRWHTVHLKRNRKNGTMFVNDQPAVEGEAPGQYTGLDLVQPFYVGSVPSYANIPRSAGFTRGFIGAISQIQIKGVDVNMAGEAERIEGITPDRYVCADRPCQNDALCLPANTRYGFRCRCRPGFVGEYCEIEGERCYDGACGENGVCYNLPDKSKPSFMCACPMGYADEGCRQAPVVIDPAFNKTSWISYPTLTGLFHLRLRLTFKPRSLTDGIILYNAHMQDGSMDFIAIIVKNRYLEFRFDTGNGVAVLRSREPLVVDRWTHVMVDRKRNEGMLVVDNGDPVVEQVKPNDRLFQTRLERGDISRATSTGKSVGLNLERPLFLGGVDPRETVNLDVGTFDGFVGCVGEVVIGETQLDLTGAAILTANIQDCGDRSLCDRRPCRNDARCINLSPTEYLCDCLPQYTGVNCETLIDVCVTEDPCQNGGTCSVTETGEFLCACPIGWIGTQCETERAIGTSAEFFEGGYAELPRTFFIHRGPARPEYIYMEVVTTATTGLMFWQGIKPDVRTTKDFLAIALVDGVVEFSFELGSGVGRLSFPTIDVSDGFPHTINVTRTGRNAELSVDGGEVIQGRSPGGLKMLNVPSNIFFGGLPDYQTFTDGTFTQGFSGCIRNVQLQKGPVLNFREALSGVNVRPCQ